MSTLEGIDVSHWQSVYPTKGISFVFVKASEGTAADPKYGVHALRATAAGLHLGAYHFCRNDVDIDAQAAFFVAHAPAAQALALDNEGQYALNRTALRRLITAVKAHDSRHRLVGLYMSESAPFLTGVGADFAWVANWSGVPSIPWDIHQHGIVGSLDRDRAKDQATLNRIFGASTAAPHYHAIVTTPTALWNDSTHRWVYNGRNAVKVGTQLIVRAAKYVKGGQTCYPIVGPLYAGYYVPVAHVKLGTRA